MTYTYSYPRPAVGADNVVFGFDGQKLYVLLIKRKYDPFKGQYALPGGFVDENETCEQAALRELKEETGLEVKNSCLVGVFSQPDRDPRGRVMSVVFFTLEKKYFVEGHDDAEEAIWIPLSTVRELALAFDHAKIVEVARQRLVTETICKPIGVDVLPEKFSFGQLHRLYEEIYQKSINIRSLQRKLEKFNYLVSGVGMDEKSRKRRKFFSFDILQYTKLQEQGFGVII